MPIIKLANNKKEQQEYENYADLFAIIKTTEKLERAYTKDIIGAKDYENECKKLIGQYRTLWITVQDTVKDLETFSNKYFINCPLALRRLQSGIPATIEHGTADTGDSNSHVNIANTVSLYISTMDTIRLGIVAIMPYLHDLLNALSKISNLESNNSIKDDVSKWITKLHGYAANYELPEEDRRQLLYDLEQSYNKFRKFLEEPK